MEYTAIHDNQHFKMDGLSSNYHRVGSDYLGSSPAFCSYTPVATIWIIIFKSNQIYKKGLPYSSKLMNFVNP